MADSLQLDIVTPQASVYSGPASEVVLPAWEGQLGVYPHHDALLALLRAGRCAVTTAAGVQTYVIGRGFAGIGPDRTEITLVADPSATTNRHEISARGGFGSLEVVIDNNPLPANPKSSAMAALGLVRAITNRATAIAI